MTEQMRFSLNGVPTEVTADPETPLLYILRNDLGIVSPRYGCGEEQCGACRVIVDDEAVFSCTFTVGSAAGRVVRTPEGLLAEGKLHPLQEAFLEENAGQCGYCLSGIVTSATLLLERNAAPNRAEIQEALREHLCRCGAHNRIIRAVERAARELRDG